MRFPEVHMERPDWMLEPLSLIPAPAASPATKPAITDPLCSTLRTLCSSHGDADVKKLVCWEEGSGPV